MGHACTCATNSNTPCDGNLACCDAGCIDVQDDLANCGACGNACGAGKICVEGACKACDVTCEVADHRCGGTQLQAKIIGAGSTDDPSESTILKTTSGQNLAVASATSLTLMRVHVRGTRALDINCVARGIRITSSSATIRRSVFSHFGTKWCLSGISFEGSTVELIDSEMVDNYT